MRSTQFAHDLSGLALLARDGGVGHVRDLYIDDRRWSVRYLVADVRHGMSSRRILISPVCVTDLDVHHRRAHVSLTREQLWHGPDVDTDRPVSRQHEIALHEYFGIPFYWTDDESPAERAGDPHLRSVRAVRGYAVIAGDTAIGHVEDFTIDVAQWRVTGVAVRQRRWLSGPHRSLPVGAIRNVSWVGKTVYVEVSALERVDQPA
jgi:hypothetical protein